MLYDVTEDHCTLYALKIILKILLCGLELGFGLD